MIEHRATVLEGGVQTKLTPFLFVMSVITIGGSLLVSVLMLLRVSVRQKSTRSCTGVQVKVARHRRTNESIWRGGATELQALDRILFPLVVRPEEKATSSRISLKFPLPKVRIEVGIERITASTWRSARV